MIYQEPAENNIVIFFWIASDIGIAGNEKKTDKAAQKALNSQSTNILVPHTNFRPNIIEYTKHLSHQNGMKTRQ